MRRFLIGLVVIGGSAAAGPPDEAPSGALAIYATRIYVSPDAPPIDDGVVIMRDGKIIAVGARDNVPVEATTSLPQCAAGVVTAGFQNSHVHFTEPKWSDATTQPAGDLSRHLQEMLNRYGYTTVVDTGSLLGNTLGLRKRIASGELPGPRILTVGLPLYPHNGIPFYLRDLPPEFLAQLPQPSSADEALSFTRTNLDHGADATKLFVMTPQGGGKAAFMTREVSMAAVGETHRRGLPVLAHPTDVEGVRIAIAIGVDVLVHTTLGNAKAVWEPELIADLLAHNMAVVPTLKLWPYELAKAGLPQRIIDLATGDAVEQLRSFSAAGGQVLFGTDVGYMIDYDPTDEYRLMARAVTPMQILASLTTAPAARWRESEKRGRIAAGMDADLVVLESDPAADATNFSKARCTIRGGRVIYAAPPSSD